MNIKKLDISYVLIFFLVLYIIILFLIINNKNSNSNDSIIANDSFSIEFLVSGSYENIGCLSVYIDDNTEGNEYSFDSGKNWQKSNYGAIYNNGNTFLLVRNKDKKIIYQREINVTSIVNEAPVIQIDFDKKVNGISDKDLLNGVTSTYNKENINSKVQVNILDQVEDEVLVSYLAMANGKKCYLVRNAIIDNNKTIATPSPTTPIVVYNDWVWPTTKPYGISQQFKENKHNGVDIYGPKRGSAIYAARDGEIVDISHNSSSGYYVTIKHDNGYYTRYAHMQNIYGNDKIGGKGSATKYIKVGQRVKAKDQIGEIGSSGHSTGLHLHFEIWNGKPFKSKAFNPLSFYKN